MVDKMAKRVAQHPVITVWFVFMIGHIIPLLAQLITVDDFIFQEAVVTVAIYLAWIWVNRKNVSRNKPVISVLMILFGLLLAGVAFHIIPVKYVILTYLIAGDCWLGSFGLAVKEMRKNSNA
ncbi:MAG: hypothetical protein LKF37_10530 [Lentilactobacillus diolivorans]|nr:hypothetical protein [Lentilactobacillus diolivorans]RRG03779.1 MAG: hypothetical protein DUD34_02495 [Lactobacillus sp.]